MKCRQNSRVIVLSIHKHSSISRYNKINTALINITGREIYFNYTANFRFVIVIIVRTCAIVSWIIVSYLRYLCLFPYSGVQHIWCWVFVLFVFVLCIPCCQFNCFMSLLLIFNCQWEATWNFIHLYCMGDNSVFPQLLCYQIVCT